MKFLLDSNIFMQAKNDYYRFDVCPGFWRWIERANAKGQVYSIQNVRDELRKEVDNLNNWSRMNGGVFQKCDHQTLRSFAMVAEWVEAQERYQPAMKAHFLGGADPMLIAHAHAHNFHIVTWEKNEPTAKAVKIPVVCQHFGVECTNLFDVLVKCKATFDLRDDADEL